MVERWNGGTKLPEHLSVQPGAKRRSARSTVPPFHRSTVPPFHRSTVPPFHRSTVPPFHRSTVPPFRSAMYTRSSRSECVILRRQSLIRPGIAASLAVALALAFAAPIFAHDIPSSVTVLAFVKPEARRLRLVMRVPLESMRDMNFPLIGPGYLDLARANPLLSDATQLWLANEIELYEDDTRLPTPRIVATRVSLPSDR